MISATRCLPPCPYPSATMARHGGYARLNRLLAATVQIFALGGPAIARRVFGIRPDTPGIDGFIRAARLLRDGQPNTDLRAATDALGRTTQDTGLDQFKPFLRRADEHLTGQSGLLTLVRGELGAAAPRTAAPVLPMPGRLPWGRGAGGASTASAPRPGCARGCQGHDQALRPEPLQKPADVTAAYAFLWAEDRGPWLFGTPQTGQAMPAMAERAMQVAQADPDLFDRAVAGDETAQRAFLVAVALPVPGIGIETCNDEERAFVAQMVGEGKSGAAIQAALDGLRGRGNRATAEKQRNTPGIAVASTPLARVDGP